MFKRGQRVVFVDCDYLPKNPDVIYPELNEIVTIDSIGQIVINGPVFCGVKEYPKSLVSDINLILGICFRPIDETFAEETLERILSEIKEEEICHM